jgi:hypothetical protein
MEIGNPRRWMKKFVFHAPWVDPDIKSSVLQDEFPRTRTQ